MPQPWSLLVSVIARSNILYTAPGYAINCCIIGLATAILAATIAIQQNDIKKYWLIPR
jgi:NADH-quinone oxidoreductase subunit L